MVVIPDAINGLDLCSLQERAGPIDAKAIREAGFEFAYVKSSQYSSTRDGRFSSLVDRLRSAGLRVGAYHFCSHDSNPEAQAEFFYKASGGLGSKPGELPPMVDWEFCTPSNYQAPKYPDGHPAHCVKWLGRHLRAVQQLWYPSNDNMLVRRYAVVYSYPTYCGSHQPALSQQVGLNEHPLCYASYGSPGVVPGNTMELPYHHLPLPWKSWTLCQYSGDKGANVPGISGACDRQVFNGASGAFDLFCGVVRPASQPSWPVL